MTRLGTRPLRLELESRLEPFTDNSIIFKKRYDLERASCSLCTIYLRADSLSFPTMLSAYCRPIRNYVQCISVKCSHCKQTVFKTSKKSACFICLRAKGGCTQSSLRCATTTAITFASTPATVNAHSYDFLTQKSCDSCDAIPATNRANYAHRMRLNRLRSSQVKRSGFYDSCDEVENFLLCRRNRKQTRL